MNIPSTNLSGSIAGLQGTLGGATGISGGAANRNAASESGGFTSALASAVDQVHQLQTTAEQKVSGLISGSGEDIHTTTLAVERASLAFDLMLQVRNKVVNAYQEISRLQF